MFMIVLSMLSACMKNVYPSADGKHSVVLLTDNKREGSSEALQQAKRYCKKQKKQHMIDQELISYVCQIKEEDYIRAKKIADVAQMAGGAINVRTVDGSDVANTGGILGTAGSIADSALGDCYEVKLFFQCQ